MGKGMMKSREFGDIFKKTRETRGITPEEAHRFSRIHPNVIRDIENGVLDRLGPIYTRSFVKKYAGFLELDMEDMLAKYDSIVSPVPDKTSQESLERPVIAKLVEERTLFEKTSKETFEKRRVPDVLRSHVMIICIALAAAVLFGFVFIESMWFGAPRKTTSIKEMVRPEKATKVKKKKAIVKPPKEPFKIDEPEKAAPPVVEKGFAKTETRRSATPLVLTLKASDKVWIQVFEGDKTVFVGTLESGGSKTIRSDKDLTVWTGKGEYLEFVINGSNLGKVVDGVKKDISVSGQGIKIGGKWVKRID